MQSIRFCVVRKFLSQLVNLRVFNLFCFFAVFSSFDFHLIITHSSVKSRDTERSYAKQDTGERWLFFCAIYFAHGA